MGLILDSSVLIAAERKGQNARQTLTSLSSQIGFTDIAISVVTLIELAHGAVRADTPERRTTRQQFLQELQGAVPIHPVTIPMALRAGRLDGENTAKGIRLALADLLIGVTARHPRQQFATPDRFFWVALRRLWPGWKRALILVRPETVVRWHRAGFKLYWTWVSRRRRRRGRRPTPREVRDLIFRMVAENRTWGVEDAGLRGLRANRAALDAEGLEKS